MRRFSLIINVPSFVCLPSLTLQENSNLVAAIFPHKVLNSARKCIFPSGINLPINRMPVNFLTEISTNNFVQNLKAESPHFVAKNSARNF
jgi:hypothetical protein